MYWRTIRRYLELGKKYAVRFPFDNLDKRMHQFKTNLMYMYVMGKVPNLDKPQITQAKREFSLLL